MPCGAFTLAPMSGTYFRDDLAISASSFSDSGAEYVVRAGDRYYAVDRVTREIVELIRGCADEAACLARISGLLGRPVDNLEGFVAESFPPAWRQDQAMPRRHPFLVRFTLMGPAATELASRLGKRLFGWHGLPIAATAVIASALLFHHARLAEAAAQASSPTLVLLLAVAGVLVHELGHASALSFVGGRSSGIGCGLYWGFPTFYADVTECWRFDRRGKVLVTLGGVYFQVVYMTVAGTWLLYLGRATDTVNLLALTSMLVVHTLNPALKFDGYWLLNDALGKTNLHRDIGNIALGAVRTPGFARPDRSQWSLLGFYLACAALQLGYLAWVAYHGMTRNLHATMAEPGAVALGAAALVLVFAAISLVIAWQLASTAARFIAQRRKARHAWK